MERTSIQMDLTYHAHSKVTIRKEGLIQMERLELTVFHLNWVITCLPQQTRSRSVLPVSTMTKSEKLNVRIVLRKNTRTPKVSRNVPNVLREPTLKKKNKHSARVVHQERVRRLGVKFVHHVPSELGSQRSSSRRATNAQPKIKRP